jgi:hypothetical protein
MIGQNVRCYVLNISTDEDDPLIYGPYTERKARSLASQFNEKIDPSNFGFIHATALRISNPQSISQVLVDFGQS